MHDPQVRSPTVREQTIEIQAHNGVLRWRVHEPRPLRALRVVGQVSKVLGPLLVQILTGRIRLPKVSRCPHGHEDPERINGDRWLCRAMNEHGDPCGEVWPVEWLVDDRGVPLVLTWGLAMSSEDWRAKIGTAIVERLEALDGDGDMVEDLVVGLLVGACEVQYPGVQQWIPITTAQQLEDNVATCRSGAAVLLQLAYTALATWALPMLAGAGEDPMPAATSPATKASETAGVLSPTAPATPRSARVPPRNTHRRG